MRLLKRTNRSIRTGKVLVFVALSLPAMLGAVALALDGGLLLSQRRMAQAVADAAALAGASELFKAAPRGASAGSSDARSAALAIAAANGFTNDGTSSTVMVNIPPASGSFAGRGGYIEVITQWNQSRGISRIWSSNPVAIQSRAVARGLWSPPNVGVLTLDPTASPSTSAVGNASLTVNGASVVTDSLANGGLSTTDNASMRASDFLVSGHSYVGHSFWPNPQTDVSPTPDPLRGLPEPAKPAPGTLTKSGNDYTLTPGSFGGVGETTLPNFTGNTTITLTPGLYYLSAGGLSAAGNTTVKGTGVILFNAASTGSTNNNISIAGNSNVIITPPGSGPYQGLVYFQSRSSSSTIALSGNGVFRVDGTFYLPSGSLVTSGNGSMTVGSQIICRRLTLSGNGSVVVDSTSPNKARTRQLELVE